MIERYKMKSYQSFIYLFIYSFIYLFIYLFMLLLLLLFSSSFFLFLWVSFPILFFNFVVYHVIKKEVTNNKK